MLLNSESLLQFIQLHSQWAWLVVFLIAFIESIAILGLLMPGWVLLVGIGTLIGTDVLDFFPIVVAAYCGAVIGEYLSYIVGYHYHQKILNWKFVSRHQQLIEQTKLFFEKHGIAGVFFGRFIGPVRAVIPLVAGIAEMPKRTFLWVNITSGLIWAPLYLIPGILAGAAYQIDQELFISLLLLLLLIGLVLWFAIKQTRRAIQMNKSHLEANLFFAWLNTGLVWLVLLLSITALVNSQYALFMKEIISLVFKQLV